MFGSMLENELENELSKFLKHLVGNNSSFVVECNAFKIK
jgi:hypothetical protein